MLLLLAGSTGGGWWWFSIGSRPSLRPGWHWSLRGCVKLTRPLNLTNEQLGKSFLKTLTLACELNQNERSATQLLLLQNYVIVTQPRRVPGPQSFIYENAVYSPALCRINPFNCCPRALHYFHVASNFCGLLWPNRSSSIQFGSDSYEILLECNCPDQAVCCRTKSL